MPPAWIVPALDELEDGHSGKRAHFVRAPHETSVSNHVGGKNRGKPTFQLLTPSITRLNSIEGKIHADETAPRGRVLMQWTAPATGIAMCQIVVSIDGM